MPVVHRVETIALDLDQALVLMVEDQAHVRRRMITVEISNLVDHAFLLLHMLVLPLEPLDGRSSHDMATSYHRDHHRQLHILLQQMAEVILKVEIEDHLSPTDMVQEDPAKTRISRLIHKMNEVHHHEMIDVSGKEVGKGVSIEVTGMYPTERDLVIMIDIMVLIMTAMIGAEERMEEVVVVEESMMIGTEKEEGTVVVEEIEIGGNEMVGINITQVMTVDGPGAEVPSIEGVEIGREKEKESESIEDKAMGDFCKIWSASHSLRYKGKIYPD